MLNNRSSLAVKLCLKIYTYILTAGCEPPV